MEVKIISLVRDPVARNISDFFHDFEDWAGKPPEQIHGGLEGIKRVFLETFDHDYTLRWFDRWEDTLEVNVYDRPFPSSGHTIIKTESADILLIRLEKEDIEKEKVISDFLELDKLKLNRKNLGSKNKHGKIYSEFKKTVNLPEEYINRMYESKFFRHFYHEGYRRKFSKRWN